MSAIRLDQERQGEAMAFHATWLTVALDMSSLV